MFPNIELQSEEIVIVDGMCLEEINRRKLLTKVTLTNQRLIFQAKDKYEGVYSLNSIDDIKVKKFGKFVNEGLIIRTKHVEKEIIIDYASDWKVLIEDSILNV